MAYDPTSGSAGSAYTSDPEVAADYAEWQKDQAARQPNALTTPSAPAARPGFTAPQGAGVNPLGGSVNVAALPPTAAFSPGNALGQSAVATPGGFTPIARGGEGYELSKIQSAILGQESGNNSNIGVSSAGAHGPGQIEPATFAQYAKPGESIDNPADNRAVSGRILADYNNRWPQDPGRVATAYFSGPGNVAPPGSPNPWIHDYKDPNGKYVSSYVSDINGRLGAGGGGAESETASAGSGAAAPMSSSDRYAGMMKMALLQQAMPHLAFHPVDYDPFKVAPKAQQTPILGTGAGPGMAEGGLVPPELSPSGGAKTDDVKAPRLNVGEFIIPKDVVEHLGSGFFHKAIEKARSEMGEIGEGAGASPPAEGAYGGGGLVSGGLGPMSLINAVGSYGRVNQGPMGGGGAGAGGLSRLTSEMGASSQPGTELGRGGGLGLGPSALAPGPNVQAVNEAAFTNAAQQASNNLGSIRGALSYSSPDTAPAPALTTSTPQQGVSLPAPPPPSAVASLGQPIGTPPGLADPGVYGGLGRIGPEEGVSAPAATPGVYGQVGSPVFGMPDTAAGSDLGPTSGVMGNPALGPVGSVFGSLGSLGGGYGDVSNPGTPMGGVSPATPGFGFGPGGIGDAAPAPADTGPSASDGSGGDGSGGAAYKKGGIVKKGRRR